MIHPSGRSQPPNWPQTEYAVWLRTTRKKRGMSQLALARAAGISRSYLSRLEHPSERKVPQPKYAVVTRLANALRADERSALAHAGYAFGDRSRPFVPQEVKEALMRDPEIGPAVAGALWQLYMFLRKQKAR